MLTRWNNGGWIGPSRIAPMRTSHVFDELRRQMDQVFVREDDTVALGTGANSLYFDVTDEGDALKLRVELPGFRQEDIDVQVERQTLTISGRRRTEVPEGYTVRRRERGTLEFSRAMRLPYRVDADAAKATLANGFLDLTLPKAPEEQKKRIEVGVT